MYPHALRNHDGTAVGQDGLLHGASGSASALWTGAVGIHDRQAPVGCWLCHGPVRQVAPGRSRGAAAYRSRLRRMVGLQGQHGRSRVAVLCGVPGADEGHWRGVTQNLGGQKRQTFEAGARSQSRSQALHGRVDRSAHGGLHRQASQGRQAVLCVHRAEPFAPAREGPSRVRPDVTGSHRRVFRHDCRDGFPRRTNPRRDRAGWSREQHHCDLQQRQWRGGNSWGPRWVERALARLLFEPSLRRFHASAGDDPLAQPRARRCGVAADADGSRLAADIGGDGGGIEPRADGSPNRRHRCLFVHAWHEHHDGAGHLRLLRAGRGTDVREVGEYQGHPSLRREFRGAHRDSRIGRAYTISAAIRTRTTTSWSTRWT